MRNNISRESECFLRVFQSSPEVHTLQHPSQRKHTPIYTWLAGISRDKALAPPPLSPSYHLGALYHGREEGISPHSSQYVWAAILPDLYAGYAGLGKPIFPSLTLHTPKGPDRVQHLDILMVIVSLFMGIVVTLRVPNKELGLHYSRHCINT